MATSGTTTFLPLFDDLLLDAWERLGLSPTILNGDVVKSARRSLQLMLIDWTNDGLQTWQVDRMAILATVGQALYVGPDDTIDILEVWVTAYGSDLLLYGMGRDEFAGIPNKLVRGRPTGFWTERRRDVVVLHLWPVPDFAYPIRINRIRLPEDVGSLSQSPDVPVLWAEACTAGLAQRLALKYAPDRFMMLKAEAGEAYGRANVEDRERVAMRVAPDMREY